MSTVETKMHIVRISVKAFENLKQQAQSFVKSVGKVNEHSQWEIPFETLQPLHDIVCDEGALWEKGIGYYLMDVPWLITYSSPVNVPKLGQASMLAVFDDCS